MTATPVVPTFRSESAECRASGGLMAESCESRVNLSGEYLIEVVGCLGGAFEAQLKGFSVCNDADEIQREMPHHGHIEDPVEAVFDPQCPRTACAACAAPTAAEEM